MADKSVDTVTPLDGDGRNVVVPSDNEAAVPTDNISEAEYTTQGKTKVATRPGYRFAPANKDIPVVTSTGINVTAEQAEALIAESDGLVSKVEDKE